MQIVMERALYPDISGILAAKAQRRRALAALPWEEKVAIIEQMRVLLPKGLWRDRTVSTDEETDKRMEKRIGG
jgi:hypothetical protein